MTNSSESPARWRTLAILALAELLGMSLWFSGSAVIPALRAEWHLGDSAANWLTLSVQLGFVAGTLLSAALNLRTSSVRGAFLQLPRSWAPC